MKTSNKIFISFLIFLFCGIIALYAGDKIYAQFYSMDKFDHQEKALPPFSVVVAEPGAVFFLKSGKENKIIQSHRKEDVPKLSPFVVRNDTLFISSAQKEQVKKNKYYFDSEVFCVNIKSIVAKENAYVNMTEFNANTLDISTKKAKLDWRGFDKVAFISVEAKDSDIYLEGKKLGKVLVNLDKTVMRTPLNKRIEDLSGSLKNDTKCSFYMSNNIHLNADKTSKYDFYMLEN